MFLKPTSPTSPVHLASPLPVVFGVVGDMTFQEEFRTVLLRTTTLAQENLVWDHLRMNLLDSPFAQPSEMD
jgi:hypothetical protein